MLEFIKCYFCGHKWKYIDISIPQNDTDKIDFKKKCKNCKKITDKFGKPLKT